MRSGRPGRPQVARGFALVLILVLVAVIGLVSASTVTAGLAIARRQAEDDLLAIGAEYRAALISYSAGNPEAGPPDLQDLLRDPRAPGIRRHLRKVYADPLSGRPQWGLLRGPNGRIIGIHSLAPGVPAKQAGFDERFTGFDGATSYSQWVFSIQPLFQLRPR